MSASIQYRQVQKTYPKTNRPAVEKVDLTAPAGKILALVGESGSGKTTLLRLAAGLEYPDTGEILIDDSPVADHTTWVPPEKRRIGMIFQDGALFPHLTAAQNVAYGLHDTPKESQTDTIDRFLTMVGLSDYSTRFPHELSGGERQRLAVARALAPQPAALLLDEPFSNLDPALRRSLRDEIRAILTELNTTAIIVTHDTDDALAIAHQIAVLEEGKITQVGPPAEVYRHPANGYGARLFGPANFLPSLNGSPEKWLRPEDCTITDPAAGNTIPVEVISVQNTGRHTEIIAQPSFPDPAPHQENWLLHSDETSPIAPGDQLHVALPGQS
ncbi:MAG: ABC transporter ATP-binding protein [Verrucomicrobiota bacterium]